MKFDREPCLTLTPASVTVIDCALR